MRNTPIDVVLQPFQNIGNGLAVPTKYSVEILACYDYWDLFIDLLGGLDETMITLGYLKVNGSVIWEFTGPELSLINQFYNMPLPAAAGGVVLALPMRRYGISGGVQGFNKTEQTLLSGSSKDLSLESTLNCGSEDPDGRSITNVTLELWFNGTPAMGTLQALVYGRATDPYPGGPGLLPILSRNVFNAVSGRNTLTKANAFAIGDILHQQIDAVHMFPTAPIALDNFEIYYQKNLIIARTDIRNRWIQQAAGVRTPQATMNSFDWSEDSYGDQALITGPATADLYARMDASVGGSVTVYQKALGKLF